MTSSHELRRQILDEMNARRTPHKTYIDAEWLLNEYEKSLSTEHAREVTAEYEKGFIEGQKRAFGVDKKRVEEEAVKKERERIHNAVFPRMERIVTTGNCVHGNLEGLCGKCAQEKLLVLERALSPTSEDKNT